MNSKDLQTTQKTLEELAKFEIDQAMTDYTKVNRLLKVIKEVDQIRRKTWNEEKFGVYDEIADNVTSLNNFCEDDIPF